MFRVGGGCPDNVNGDLVMSVGDVLYCAGGKVSYLVIDLLGSGAFGQVVRCRVQPPPPASASASPPASPKVAMPVDLELPPPPAVGREVAVKVSRNNPVICEQGLVEAQLLFSLSARPGAEDSIVAALDVFIFRDHVCLVMELLAMTLIEVLTLNEYRGLSLVLISLWGRTLLQALSLLSGDGVIHADVKPENILLVHTETADIRLADFGSACRTTDRLYTYVQSRFYRSPEVLLGLPYGPPIDIWSVGCVCAELFLGIPIFPGEDVFGQMKRIIDMMGMPSDELIAAGAHRSLYFNDRGAPTSPAGEPPPRRFTLKTIEEYARSRNKKPFVQKRYFHYQTLAENIEHYPMRADVSDEEKVLERNSRAVFVHFLHGLLELDPAKRWPAHLALCHPFLSQSPELQTLPLHQQIKLFESSLEALKTNQNDA